MAVPSSFSIDFRCRFVRKIPFQVKEVASAARRRDAKLSFAFVYPDKQGRYVVRPVRAQLSRFGFAEYFRSCCYKFHEDCYEHNVLAKYDGKFFSCLYLTMNCPCSSLEKVLYGAKYMLVSERGRCLHIVFWAWHAASACYLIFVCKGGNISSRVFISISVVLSSMWIFLLATISFWIFLVFSPHYTCSDMFNSFLLITIFFGLKRDYFSPKN